MSISIRYSILSFALVSPRFEECFVMSSVGPYLYRYWMLALGIYLARVGMLGEDGDKSLGESD